MAEREAKRVLSLSLGEVVLKGKNRRYFIQRILNHIKALTEDLPVGEIHRNAGKIDIEVRPEDEEELYQRLSHVFGIVYITPTDVVALDPDTIDDEVRAYVGKVLEAHPEYRTFKVVTKRNNKAYPMDSQALNAHLGGVILAAYPQLQVDVHQPQLFLHVDVKEELHLYYDKRPTFGGLPLGTNGKGLLMLSGGIDSPVAGFLMAKRGVQVDFLHFHSYPFTSQRAEEKVLALARILSRYLIKAKVYSVNILPIQKELNRSCPPEEMTVLSRRFMMRIANRLAKEHGYKSVITGENLGQVASQTIDGITVMNNVAEQVVFRPLVGMDKIDIIQWAHRIGTYETSILPYEDCCTVFLPDHPSLRPTEEDMRRSEEALDIDGLVEAALETVKVHKVTFKEEL
ncbi:MAG: tRNA uracil 4-sulfurtransferase ThiI [Tissierellia bacterium]|nr:tRNA uracil 4-sulfurtransferase ThiI [Tissierellia bacterium]